MAIPCSPAQIGVGNLPDRRPVTVLNARMPLWVFSSRPQHRGQPS